MRPAPFTTFCTLGPRTTLGQRAFAKVAYDGLEPAELTGEEREKASEVWGPIDTIPPAARRVVVQNKGREVGGTRLAAERAAHLGLTLPITRADEGETVYVFFGGPKARHGRVGLRFARRALKKHGARFLDDSADGFTILRHDGRRVRFEVFAASRGGDNTRGVPVVCAVLTEAAFYFDESTGVNNGEAIFAAIIPRLLPGGQIIIESTPWAEGSGLHWREFSRNFGKPTTALAANCPTLVMRDDAETREMVAQEYERDAENARRELGAEFLPVGAVWFFDPRAVDAAVDEALVLPQPKAEYVSVGCGADFGFRSDSSALVVVQRDSECFAVADVVEQRPEKDKPLQPSSVVAHFAGAIGRYGATSVRADGHYRESIREHLSHSKLYLWPAPEGAIGKAETYQLARTLLLERRVRLPKHERLLRQLREVVARPTAGGGVSISSPRWRTGGHGDIVSAFVLALYDASQRAVPEPPEVIADEERERRKQWAEREAARLAVARRNRAAEHEDEFAHAAQRLLNRRRVS